MTIRLNLSSSKKSSIRTRYRSLDLNQKSLFKFWKQFYTDRFAMWAAEQNLQPPNFETKSRIPADIQLRNTLEKRIQSIDSVMITDKVTRQEAIDILDSDTALVIETLKGRGVQNIDDDNIFFSYSG